MIINTYDQRLNELRRVLIIGSNSFTGSHIVEHLHNVTNAEVLGISRSEEYSKIFLPYRYQKLETIKNFTYKKLDINLQIKELEDISDEFQPELVFNFAAQGEVRNSWKWPIQWYDTNCLGAVKVAEVFRGKSYLHRYIVASTPEVYGSSKGGKLAESKFYDPSTPYAASKLAGDLHLNLLFKKEGFPVIFTRAANLYGAHQQLYRIIPRTIISLLLGKKIDLHGRGEGKRAFIHARDVADATLRAALLGHSGRVYHLSPDDSVKTIATVVSSICKLMNKKFEDNVNFVDENFGQDSCYELDSVKARNELSWKPKVKFDTGLAEVIDWVKDNWSEILIHPHDYVHK